MGTHLASLFDSEKAEARQEENHNAQATNLHPRTQGPGGMPLALKLIVSQYLPGIARMELSEIVYLRINHIGWSLAAQYGQRVLSSAKAHT